MATLDTLELADLDDLEFGELTVTAMRDSVALPETGASTGACSCCCPPSSCCQTE